MGGGSYRLKSIRKTALILLLLITLISVIYFKNNDTKTNTVNNIVSGNIKNDIANFSLVSIYLDGEKSPNNEIPKSGYALDLENTKCTLNGEKLSNITFKYENGKVGVYGINEAKTKCNFYFNKIPTLAEYIMAIYNNKESVGAGELNYHNNTIDVNNDGIMDDAGDNSYRYSGNNPNNFVCFGVDDCSQDTLNEHLYRIIGVYPTTSGEYQVKLIKAEYITEQELGLAKFGSGDMHNEGVATSMANITPRVKTTTGVHQFQWIGTNLNNNWNNSQIKKALNDEENGYLSKFTNEWRRKISNTTWIIGGVSYEGNNLQTTKNLYNVEVGANKLKVGDENKCVNDNGEYTPCTLDLLETQAQIGLMYASDFGYAPSKNFWTGVVSQYNLTIPSNWLYNGFYEFTITRNTDYANSTIHIDAWGYLGNWPQPNVACQVVRPVFYLNTDVLYASGDGSEDNPFYLSI